MPPRRSPTAPPGLIDLLARADGAAGAYAFYHAGTASGKRGAYRMHDTRECRRRHVRSRGTNTCEFDASSAPPAPAKHRAVHTMNERWQIAIVFPATENTAVLSFV